LLAISKACSIPCFAAVQMIDGRELLLERYTEPEKVLKLELAELTLAFANQPQHKIAPIAPVSTRSGSRGGRAELHDTRETA
jgi:hypothetical protein